MLLLNRLTGTELVFDRHQVDAITLPLLFLPAGAANAQLLKNSAAELLELVLCALINNDSIRPAADDLLNRHLPGAENAFTQQRNTKGSHHQGGEFPGFNVECEAQHPAELTAGFGDHLTVDHAAVTLRIESLTEGISGIHKNHIADLPDAIQRHPTGQAGQKTGQRVVTQANGHHLPAVDVHDHFPHHAQTTSGITGDHLGPHQLGAQPQAVAWYADQGVVRRRGLAHSGILAQAFSAASSGGIRKTDHLGVSTTGLGDADGAL